MAPSYENNMCFNRWVYDLMYSLAPYILINWYDSSMNTRRRSEKPAVTSAGLSAIVSTCMRSPFLVTYMYACVTTTSPCESGRNETHDSRDEWHPDGGEEEEEEGVDEEEGVEDREIRWTNWY